MAGPACYSCCCCRCRGDQGAGVGLVCSLAVAFWVGFGAIFIPKPPRPADPALNTLMCNVSGYDVNVTYVTTTMLTSYSPIYVNSTTSSENTTLSPERSVLVKKRRLLCVLEDTLCAKILCALEDTLCAVCSFLSPCGYGGFEFARRLTARVVRGGD